MANVLIEEKTMTDIANAIREKNGTDTTYKPAEMPQAVRDIKSEDTGIGSRQWWLDVCTNKTNFSYMFATCTSLTTIPQLDTSKGTTFNNMFSQCENLTTIPQLDTSKGTRFNNMFLFCENLTTIPQLDTSKGTTFSSMFSYCQNLTTIPQLDTSKGTSFNFMFNYCQTLTTIPQLDTSKGTNFSSMFSQCENLTTIPQLDTSKGTNFQSMFWYCSNLTTVYFVKLSINRSISFAQSPLLNDESKQSIFDGLADLTGHTAQTITFHPDVKNKLTEEQIASATSKNWNIA